MDAGEVIPGIAPPATDARAASADRVLVVTAAIWCRSGTPAPACGICGGLGLGLEAIAVVVNRREGRGQYGASEVERALAVPVLAAVPEDRARPSGD